MTLQTLINDMLDATEPMDGTELYDALCEEMTAEQLVEEIMDMAAEAPDMTLESEAELDRLTDQLAVELGN